MFSFLCIIMQKKISERSENFWNFSVLKTRQILVFFRLTFFFFQEQKIFFQGTTCIQFFRYCKAKKNFGAIRKILKIFIFENLLQKKHPKGEISIYTDFGPPRYVLTLMLWCSLAWFPYFYLDCPWPYCVINPQPDCCAKKLL